MSDFYVYAWLRPCGTPFYIGKGRGNRDCVYKRQNLIFDRIVKKMRAYGADPAVVRWVDGISEDDAFSLERAYIKLFGRIDDGTGILANLTSGGGGTSGKVVSIETRARQSASLKGKRPPQETREAVALANAARHWSTSDRMAMSFAVVQKPPLSQYKGICLYRRTGRWMAQITVNGAHRCIGYFATQEEAARAYDIAAFEAWGRDCYLNFPAERTKDAA